MRIRLVKWLCIALLLLALSLWNLIADYELALRFAVCAGAVIVAVQAFRAAKNRWGVIFLAIAFNPVIVFVRLAEGVGVFAVLLSTGAFMLSLAALKPRPLLSMASITGRNPGSESL